jgi:hypothetical protein
MTTKEIKKLDTLTSKKVREKGRCELEGKDHLTCKGNLQTMHIISRRYRLTRWFLDNLLCGCAAHHFYYTTRPEEWRQLLDQIMPHLYDKLWDIAWNGGKKEVLFYEDILNKLKETK